MQNPQNNKRSNKKRKDAQGEKYRTVYASYRRRRFTGANMAVVLCSVLFISVFAASIYYIVGTERPKKSDRDDIVNSFIADNESTPPEALISFDEITLNSDDIHSGDLILVNYEYKYEFPAEESHLSNVYSGKSDNYSVAYNDYLLDSDVLEQFNAFVDKLSETTGESCLLVNSTYRSLEEQQSIYDNYVESSGEEYAKKYVADPGCSEHHTGLSLDLTIRYDDGTYVQMKDYENLEILNDICVDFGFIQRYADNKYVFTHINTEPWHYRYVGVPHAYIITQQNFCLEEYIDFLRDYTVDGEMLYLNESGETETCGIYSTPSGGYESGYLIYFVPVSENSETAVKIPSDADEYTVSGNNCDGFIVSAKFD